MNLPRRRAPPPGRKTVPVRKIGAGGNDQLLGMGTKVLSRAINPQSKDSRPGRGSTDTNPRIAQFGQLLDSLWIQITLASARAPAVALCLGGGDLRGVLPAHGHILLR